MTKLRNLPFPPSFRSFAPYEKDSTALYIFEHGLIPGILQTSEYARAVLETHPNTTEEEVSDALAALTAVTGARTAVVWFKICPVLLAGSAVLLLIASVH